MLYVECEVPCRCTTNSATFSTVLTTPICTRDTPVSSGDSPAAAAVDDDDNDDDDVTALCA